MTLSTYLPWTDRLGRPVPLKILVFVLVLAPGLWIVMQYALDLLGPRLVTEMIHQTGDWSQRILAVTLAVSPLRRIAEWPRVILVRRMLGLAALGYALIHFTLYIVDQKFDLVHVASEIILRFYLTIGFLALISMSALGLTSNDAAIRRLGAARWNRLHSAIYPIMLVALWHSALQRKSNIYESALIFGVFFWLMMLRFLRRRGVEEGPVLLAGLAAASALVAALSEALWYFMRSGIPMMRVLAANLDFDDGLRPCWWVLIIALAAVPLQWIRSRQSPRPQRVRQAPA